MKTVYILGAGFSIPAGAPAQSQILEKIISFNGPDYDIVNLPQYKHDLIHFLKEAFNLSEEGLSMIALEDVYTPIDKCISENQSFRGYSVGKLKEIRNKINLLISVIVDYELISNGNKLYIDNWVKFLVQKKVSNPHSDSFSIITTNWDILLDRRFFVEFEVHGQVHQGTIDYGCFVTSINPRDGIIPPLTIMGRGGYTIKLLKLHGSLNWLRCPNCNKIYVNKREKSGIIDSPSSAQCRFCHRKFQNVSISNGGFSLEPFFVLPTFLKELNNLHFRQIWQQAAIELLEAERLIFIGYSFPNADFEFRQLLARYVGDNCKIEIVLHGNNKPNKLNRHTDAQATEFRYKSFFGNREITFNYSGAKQYLNEMCK